MSGSPRGFTLIEVLTVVTILAIATAAMTVGLASADANARLRALGADLVDLDARARLLARTDGACELRLPSEQDRSVALALVGSDEAFTTIALPRGARLEASTTASDALETIRFDRSGRSFDYEVIVTFDDLSATWAVAGLTGWVEKQEAQP